MDGATAYFLVADISDKSLDEELNLRMHEVTCRIFIYRLQWILWINMRRVELRMCRLSASSRDLSQYRQHFFVLI